ncbi:MAG: phosphotransferase [Robiginitomaculum sp.]
MSRNKQIDTFLTKCGWGKATRNPVSGDASARRYTRLDLNGECAVLMDAPYTPQDDDPMSYNTRAKIAGLNPNAFICLASALIRRGFSAPKIFGANLKQGLLLLEDFGDTLFATVLEKNPNLESKIYSEAISVLASIYRSSISSDLAAYSTHWHVGNYDKVALQTEVDLFFDWYLPEFDMGLKSTAKQEWADLWQDSFQSLNAHAPGLALRDYHAENVFWLPKREGPARIGLIDFQDALFAHPAYDLVSLLEDARRDVSRSIVPMLISQFCREAGIEEDEKFHAAYAVSAAQRNAKILGLFVRLARRDKKRHYLDFIPRVAAHFRRDLSAPALADLKKWTQIHTSSLWSDNA